jgi:hypothetical protein
MLRPGRSRCFGPLDRLVYGPSSIRRLLQQKYGVTITRANSYAEIPTTIAELERSFATPSLLTSDGIFPDNAAMIAELDRLMKGSHEFDPTDEEQPPGRIWLGEQIVLLF